MSESVDSVAAAEERARLARARLDGSIAALREKVDPRTVAKKAADNLREQGEAAAGVALRNPGVVAGALAAVGLVILGRPVLRLFRRRKDTKAAPEHFIKHTAREGSKGKPQ